MKPKQIKVENGKSLNIIWDNGTESRISLEYLRDECPCANCKGETILFKQMRPARVNIKIPGKYDLRDIEVVGGYAIKVSWKDGHDTGLYSWEYLQTLAADEGTNRTHNYKPLV